VRFILDHILLPRHSPRHLQLIRYLQRKAWKHPSRNGKWGLSEFDEKVRALIRAGDFRISEHGYEELAEDEFAMREVLSGVSDAVVVEEFSNYPKGPCVLFLQKDRNGAPIHVVWGIPQEVMITP